MGGDEHIHGEGQAGLPAPHHVPKMLRRLLLIIINNIFLIDILVNSINLAIPFY